MALYQTECLVGKDSVSLAVFISSYGSEKKVWLRALEVEQLFCSSPGGQSNFAAIDESYKCVWSTLSSSTDMAPHTIFVSIDGVLQQIISSTVDNIVEFRTWIHYILLPSIDYKIKEAQRWIKTIPDHRNEKIVLLGKHIQTLEQKLRERDTILGWVKELKRALREKNAKLTSLEHELFLYDDSDKEYQRALRAKDDHIRELESRLKKAAKSPIKHKNIPYTVVRRSKRIENLL